MAYCELSDIVKLLPEEQLIRLTDDEGAGAVNEERVNEAIKAADEEINAYIGARYKLPLSVDVPVLKKFSVDMAIYNLYTRVTEDVPETRKDRRDAAVRFLEKVNKGEISLGVQPIPDAPDSTGYDQGVRTSVRTKIFDPTTMDKY